MEADTASHPDMATGTDVKHAVIRAAPWVVLVLAKLWLVGGQRLTAYGSLTIDDQWFVERAVVDQRGQVVRAVRRPHADQATRLPVVRGRRARRESAVAARPPAPLRLRHCDHDGRPAAVDPHAVATVGRVRAAAVQPDDDEHADLGTRRSGGHLSRPDRAAARLSRRARVVVRSTTPGHVGVGGRVDPVARSLWAVREEWLLLLPALGAVSCWPSCDWPRSDRRRISASPRRSPWRASRSRSSSERCGSSTSTRRTTAWPSPTSSRPRCRRVSARCSASIR